MRPSHYRFTARLLTGLILLLASGFFTSSQALLAHSATTRLSSRVDDGDTFQGIRLLGTVRLRSVEIQGHTLASLSGLAWDEDEQMLYAVSDKAVLFHLKPGFKNGILTRTEVLAAHPLTDNKNQPLRYPWADAEGLAVRKAHNGKKGDSEILVSYEIRPRVRVYRPDGFRLGGELLPSRLENIRNYYGRNSALEALALHPQHSILTAPQRPLRADRGIRIYAQSGHSWAYEMTDQPGNSLAAMEALPDGSLLLLERAFVAITKPLVIRLRRAELSGTSANANTVATLSTAEGWRLDNFEGLAHHQGKRFFMVSDDNGSIWQNTLLVYFELLE